MNGLWIKICGMRTVEAIETAARAGVQAVGFVFHAGSPRHLTVDEAVALQPAVPPGIARVAVFLHPSQALVDEVLSRVRPDWLQTDAGDLADLRLPAGRQVLPVLRSGRPIDESRLPVRLLFESARSGSGERADWSEAARLAAKTELVLAGGLDPDNVADAIRRVRPFGVDVSSGVEGPRGVKDSQKIQEFVAAARAARGLRAG